MKSHRLLLISIVSTAIAFSQFACGATTPEIGSPSPTRSILEHALPTRIASPMLPTVSPTPSSTPTPAVTPTPTLIPTFTNTPEISSIIQAMLPVLSGQGVPQAAVYDPSQPGPHPVVILTSSGEADNNWNMELPYGWLSPSVSKTELVVIVSEERKIDLGSQAYNIGPDITAYRYERDLELREARTGKTVGTFTFRGTDPRPFPQTASYITTSIDGTRLWGQDVESWICNTVMADECWTQVSTLSGVASDIVVFSPDGQILASGHEDATVRLWQVSDGSLIRTLYGHTDSINSVAFSPDGQNLASGSNDKTVRLWQTSNGSLIRTLDAMDFVTGLAFSPNGQTLVAGFYGGPVKLWRVSDGSTIPGWENIGGGNLAFSPDGQFLALAAIYDNSVQLRKASDGTLLYNLVSPSVDHIFNGYFLSNQVGDVAFSPDGQFLAAGYEDMFVGLWRVSDGSLLHTMWGMEGFSSVDFSPDGQTLAAGTYGGLVQLWQVSDGRLVRTLRGPWRVSSVAFSPDGQILAASGDWDSSVLLWQIR